MVTPTLVAMSGPITAFTTNTGVTWTQGGNTQINANYVKMAYSPALNMIVAVGTGASGGNGYIAWTADLGVSWWSGLISNLINSPGGTNWQLDDICWSPQLGLFAACATTFNGSATLRILTSPDGINWTGRTTPSGINLQRIAWSPELGLFVASGTLSTCITSPDGITWTSHPLPGSATWQGLVWAGDGYGNGIQKFIAMNNVNTGVNDAAWSADGINWTQFSTGIAATWNAVRYSYDLDQLIACGSSSTNVFHTNYHTYGSWVASGGLQIWGNNDIVWSHSLGWVGVSQRNNTPLSMSGINGTWTSPTNLFTQGSTGYVAIVATDNLPPWPRPLNKVFSIGG